MAPNPNQVGIKRRIKAGKSLDSRGYKQAYRRLGRKPDGGNISGQDFYYPIVERGDFKQFTRVVPHTRK